MRCVYILEEVVHDSIKFIKDDYRETISIHLDPEISEVDEIMAHRLSLMQVFANILINAAESIRRKGLECGEVRIQAAVVKEDEKARVHIRIYDDGEGIKTNVLDVKEMLKERVCTWCCPNIPQAMFSLGGIS